MPPVPTPSASPELLCHHATHRQHDERGWAAISVWTNQCSDHATVCSARLGLEEQLLPSGEPPAVPQRRCLSPLGQAGTR